MKGITILMLAAATASGCASVPPPRPEAVRFANLTAPAPAATLVDKRPAPERSTRSGENGYLSFHYLGDAATDPSVAEVLGSRIVAHLGPSSAREVELHMLEVGFWRGRGNSGGTPPPIVAFGAPVGALIVGNLIGHGIVHLMRGSGNGSDARPFASAVIEISLRGQRIRGSVNVTVDDASTPEAALEQAIEASIAQILNQLPRPEVAPNPSPSPKA